MEAALILPFFLFLVLALVQWGLILSYSISLRQAAFVGARYATLQDPEPNDAQIRTVTLEALSPMMSTAAVQNPIGVRNLVVAGLPAKEVEIVYNLRLFFPAVVPGSSGGILVIRNNAVMR